MGEDGFTTVNGPDGKPYRFPSSMDMNAIKGVMAKKFPTPSTAGDVAQSAVGGLAHGAAGLVGQFGDIQDIVRAGAKAILPQSMQPPERSILDGVASTLGADRLPNTKMVMDAAESHLPQGVNDVLNHKPQTTAGKFVNSAAEFIPSALTQGPRAVMRYGVLPGVASEAAGELTHGTPFEPAARIAAAVVAPGANRIVSPLGGVPEHLAQDVNALESAGIPLTAGQRTGNTFMRRVEDTASNLPLVINNSDAINARQGEALNRALFDTAGVNIQNPVGAMKHPDWDQAYTGFNTDYNAATQGRTLTPDTQMVTDVTTALDDFQRRTPASAQPAIVESMANDLSALPVQFPTGMGADAYQSWRSNIGKEAQAQPAGSTARAALDNLQTAIDQNMARNLPPGAGDELQALNRRYSNFKTLEDAYLSPGGRTAQGYVSPAQVDSSARARAPARSYLTGNSDVGALSQAAQAVMRPLNSSGTAERTAINSMFYPGSAMAAFSGHPLAAAAAAVAPTLLGNAVMNRPMQAYLGNGVAQRFGMGPATAQGMQSLIAPLANNAAPAPVEIR